MTSMKGQQPETVQPPCAVCSRDTRHYVRGQVRRADFDPNEMPWEEISRLLECAGCGSTSLRKISWEGNQPRDDDDWDVEVFPPKVIRRKPKWFWSLDENFRSLMKEIYDSLGTGARALPVMGARAVLDMVIQRKVGDQGSFGADLHALKKNELLSPHDQVILKAAIEAGNAAAHRGYAPKQQNVDAVMDIIEHLLNSLFVLAESAEDLKQATPQRASQKPRAHPSGKATKTARAPPVSGPAGSRRS